MDHEEVIRKMQEAIDLAQSNISKSTLIEENFDTNIEEIDDILSNDWIKSLPIAKDEEFILYLQYEGEKFAICAKELDWFTIQNIELECYKLGTLSEQSFYAELHKQKEVFKRAIVWVADINSEELIYNDGDILSKIKSDYISMIWDKYNNATNLSLKEAVSLEQAAFTYFSRQIEDKPIPPIVIEVDMLIHFGNLTWREIKAIKYSTMEKIKIVLKARSEALQFDRQIQSTAKIKQNSNELAGLPPELFPPGVRENISRLTNV
jgi:hypothetical protein